MTVWIGTSGWQYADWRGAFYPPQLRQGDWLSHYAARFAAVEINNSFYRLPSRERFQAWAAAVPDDFVHCPKASRYLSHMKKLKDPEEPVSRFVDAAGGLGRKLGPVLVQLPANFHADLDRLAAGLDEFPADWRLAVELRHDSWWTDDLYALLAEREVALCLTDRDSRPTTPLRRTASWGYVRFHWGKATPQPCYGRTALDSWAGRLADLWKDTEDVYVFFNNDPRCCAVRDARRFALACALHGREPTRTPEAGDVSVVGGARA